MKKLMVLLILLMAIMTMVGCGKAEGNVSLKVVDVWGCDMHLQYKVDASYAGGIKIPADSVQTSEVIDGVSYNVYTVDKLNMNTFDTIDYFNNNGLTSELIIDTTGFFAVIDIKNADGTSVGDIGALKDIVKINFSVELKEDLDSVVGTNGKVDPNNRLKFTWDNTTEVGKYMYAYDNRFYNVYYDFMTDAGFKHPSEERNYEPVCDFSGDVYQFRLNITDKNGIASVTVNGKKAKLGTLYKKVGKYKTKITDKLGNVTKITTVIDRKNPKVTGLKSGKTYARNHKFTVSDDRKVSIITFNSNSSDFRFIDAKKKTIDLTCKSKGNLVIRVYDDAGNKTTLKVKVK